MKSALKEFDGWQKRSHVGEQQQRLVDLSYAASYIPIHSNLLSYTQQLTVLTVYYTQQLTFLYTATLGWSQTFVFRRNLGFCPNRLNCN